MYSFMKTQTAVTKSKSTQQTETCYCHNFLAATVNRHEYHLLPGPRFHPETLHRPRCSEIKHNTQTSQRYRKVCACCRFGLQHRRRRRGALGRRPLVRWVWSIGPARAQAVRGARQVPVCNQWPMGIEKTFNSEEKNAGVQHEQIILARCV